VLAVTFVAFEALAVATILPVVGRDLGDLRLYGWMFSAFLLASLIGITLAGTLADRVPLGRPMLAGLALFAVLSTAWVVPGLIGPAVAALVAAAVGWRWVFLGLLPLVTAAGVLVVLALRRVPPPAHPATAKVPYLAVLGVVAGAGAALASLGSGVVPVVAAGGFPGSLVTGKCVAARRRAVLQ
jgi:MFS family permease